MYFPDMPAGQRRTMLDPVAEFGLPQPESVMLRMADGTRVHIWLFLHAGSSRSRPTVVFYHGNAGNMSFRGDNFRGLFHSTGANVVAVEYRGFGLSEGVPGQPAFLSDAIEALEWVAAHEELDAAKIFVLGRSIGGAVALHLASERQGLLAGLIVENTFTTIGELVDKLMPQFRYFKFLMTNPWRNIDMMANLRLPCLFICSGTDELIPQGMMKRLHDAYQGVLREWVHYPGAGHMNAHTFPRYNNHIADFFTNAMALNARHDEHGVNAK